MAIPRLMSAVGAAAVALAALSLTALPAAADRAPIAIGSPFVLAYGETIAIADSPLTVRFDAIDDDSRCPVDVLCVWSGLARLVLVVAAPDGAESPVSIDTLGGTGTAYGLTFSLLDVKPDRYANVAIAPEDYVGLFKAEVENSVGQFPPTIPLLMP